MQIVNRRLSLTEFKDYVLTYDFGTLPANKLVIHHTWKPTQQTWAGQRSINGLKAYYEQKKWPAGPHLFIAEDGIWLFSPMRANGIHASTLNARSIGIEVVGDYDLAVWSGETKYSAVGVIKVLMEHLGIAPAQVYFHRDVSAKTCPGKAITKEWLFAELDQFRYKPAIQPAVGPSVNPAPLEIPDWATQAVAFIRQHQLFDVKTPEDLHDAVKFYSYYQLIRRKP